MTKPKYILEHEDEAARLERMSEQPAYQLSKELTRLSFSAGQKVLDAGCGSGVLARYISNTFPGVVVEGCDGSQRRIEQATEIRIAEKGICDIRYFFSVVESIDVPDSTYDFVICRFVFDFLIDPVAVLKEFKRILKPHGKILVIQFDGALFNYHHNNQELTEMLKTLKEKAPFDLFRGRAIASMMLKAGLKEVDWDLEVYAFKGNELLAEKQQIWERIEMAIPTLATVFGSTEKAVRFRDLYCGELLSPGSVLFYNKFLTVGVK